MDAGSVFMLLFRLLHIASGVAWAGSVFMFVVLIQPSAAGIGPAAGPFMMELLGRRKLVSWLLSLGGLTILGGLYLYWRDAGGFDGLSAFATSRFGLVLTIGAVSAIAAFMVGLFGTRPNARRLLELSGQARAAGGPTPAMAQEIATVQEELKRLGRIGFTLIVLAVFAMATARYW